MRVLRRTRRGVLGAHGLAAISAPLVAACAPLDSLDRGRGAATTRGPRPVTVAYMGERLRPALETAARAATEASGGAHEVRLEQLTPPSMPQPAPGQPLSGIPESPLLAALREAKGSGDGPDVVVLGGPRELAPMVHEGLVRGLGQHIRSQTNEAREGLEGFHQGALEGLRARGELYGLPLSATAEVLEYDPRLFDAAGVAYPALLGSGWTQDAFLDAARRLTRDLDGDGTPDQYALFNPGSLQGWIWRAGGEVVSADGRRALVAERAAIDGIVFHAGLRRAGLVGVPQPGAARPFQYAPEGLFLGEAPHAPRAAMIIGSPSAAARPDWWPLRMAEPPRGQRQATALRLEVVAAVPMSAREPAVAYAAMLALVVEAQPHFPTPARAPTVAQLQTSLQSTTGRRWDDEDARALVAALRYARALPFLHEPAILQALSTHVSGPLAQGTSSPEHAAREAAGAIEELLRA